MLQFDTKTPIEITEYAKVIGIPLIIKEMDWGYLAKFEEADLKDGSALISEFGKGETPSKALFNYSLNISNRRIVIDAFPPGNRKEYQVPSLTHTLKSPSIIQKKRDNTQYDTILRKSIDKWGEEKQILKLQEELAELQLVLIQRGIPTKDPAEMEDKLYDELADVRIMMKQADIIFDKSRIDEREEFKLNRLNEKYLK